MQAVPAPLDLTNALRIYYRNKAEIDRIASGRGKSLQDDIYECLRSNFEMVDLGYDEYSSGDYSELVAKFKALNPDDARKGAINNQMTELYNEYISMLHVEGPAMSVDPAPDEAAVQVEGKEAVYMNPDDLVMEPRGSKRGREYNTPPPPPPVVNSNPLMLFGVLPSAPPSTRKVKRKPNNQGPEPVVVPTSYYSAYGHILNDANRIREEQEAMMDAESNEDDRISEEQQAMMDAENSDERAANQNLYDTTSRKRKGGGTKGKKRRYTRKKKQ